MMKIAIVGIGAMGSLLAARLAPLAHVTMVGHWRPQLAALQRSGLRFLELDGRERQLAVRVTNDPASVPGNDVALVLVKSYQTERAAPEAAAALAPQGIAITLQNGLGNLEILRASVGDVRAALGTTTEGATLIRPGVVRHAGRGLTYLARDPQLASGALASVAVLFEQAGLTTRIVDEVDGVVWGKLAVNAAINPLTALLDVPNGVLARWAPARTLMMMAATEVAMVAEALDISLPYADAAGRAHQVAVATQGNLSSMAQDVRNGRQTEIEAITGRIVRAANDLEVAVPVNDALLRMMRFLEQGLPWQQAISDLPQSLQPYFRQLLQPPPEEET